MPTTNDLLEAFMNERLVRTTRIARSTKELVYLSTESRVTYHVDDHMETAPRDKAREFYENHFRIKPYFHELPDALQVHMLDMALYLGRFRATATLQRAINEIGWTNGISVGTTAVLDDQTKSAIQEISKIRGDLKALNSAIVDKRIEFHDLLRDAGDLDGAKYAAWNKNAEAFRS